MGSFRIAGMEVQPGKLERGSLTVGELRDGTSVSIPLMVMNGLQDGPVLWLDAAVHGNEIPGVEVIRRIMREEVNPEELNGTIVACPVLNPFAFQAGQNWTPIYEGTSVLDLNVAFPGNPDGGVNAQAAYRIFHDGILQCDYYINYHSNYYPAVEFIPLTVCPDRRVLEDSIDMGEAFGLPLCEIAKAPGWPTYNAQLHGKPAMLVELLAHGYLDRRSIEIGVMGTKNVLCHLGMMEGTIVSLPGLKVEPGAYGRRLIFSKRGGLVHFSKGAGDWIETGEPFALIRNVYGDVVEEITAPVQGFIRTLLFGPHNEAVHGGGIIASVLESDPKRTYFGD